MRLGSGYWGSTGEHAAKVARTETMKRNDNAFCLYRGGKSLASLIDYSIHFSKVHLIGELPRRRQLGDGGHQEDSAEDEAGG